MDATTTKVLCYGDSNTWGYIPSQEEPDRRYPSTVRWTGQLQTLLGPDFLILEEGLNSRTTDVDDPDLEGKNGLAALPAVLRRHGTLNVAVVLLGTNDLKAKFARSPEQIALGLEKVLGAIRESSPVPPALLLLSPAIPKPESVYESFRYEGLKEKAHRLPPFYKALAQKYGATFLDLAPLIESSDKDGVHWEESEHLRLAEALCPLIRAVASK